MMRSLASIAISLSLLATAASARAEPEVDATPVLRFAVGPVFRVAPAAEKSVDFAVDVTAGYARLFGRGDVAFALDPEIGFSADGSGLTALNVTCGVGLGSLMAAVTYNPRLIVGTDHGATTIGMRNGLMLHAFLDMANLEIGHQVTRYDGALHQSVQLLAGVNPAAFIFPLRYLTSH